MANTAASPAKAALGGTGASTKRMVGADKFVRHNPMSDKFPVTDFDHMEIYCSDANAAAARFSISFGMQILSRSDIDNGNQRYTGVVVGCGAIRLSFVAPYWTEAPPSKVHYADPFPDFNRQQVHDFVARHGLAGHCVAFNVEDAKVAFERAVASGAKAVTRPVTVADEHGSLTYSEIEYYRDVQIRFIQGRSVTYRGHFMPGYRDFPLRPETSYGLRRIDHIVSNVPVLTEVVDHLEHVLGFHEFGEFTAEDVGTVDSGLNSMVMANNEETILLPINEPTFGTRRKSQIQSFIEHHQGPGLQHVAVHTNDILATVAKMKNASALGGIDFMPNPGRKYYEEHVPRKMGKLIEKDLIDECAAHGILIDRDDEGTLLQIFTKPLPDRPTLFFEIIQRLGCPGPNGKQKPACGGFGKGNFGALFKSIEDWEKARDGDVPQEAPKC